MAYLDISLAFSVHECLGKGFYWSGFLCVMSWWRSVTDFNSNRYSFLYGMS